MTVPEARLAGVSFLTPARQPPQRRVRLKPNALSAGVRIVRIEQNSSEGTDSPERSSKAHSDTAYRLLHRAGWSIGDSAFVGELGEHVWVVSGRNGENLVRTEGTPQGEAWRRAVEQAREVGMLGHGAGEEPPFTLS